MFERVEETLRRSALVILLFCLPAIVAIRMGFSVADPDVWWHARTGQWILENGRVPLTDPFSIQGASKPWVAYSWVFEILVYLLNGWFGLRGIVYFNVAMCVLIAIAVFYLIRRLQRRFVLDVGLTAVALVAISPVMMTPRPWLFSILFFAIELNILLDARRTGNIRRLWLLPPLFAIWANLHIEFVYGLAILGVAIAEAFTAPFLRRLICDVEQPSISGLRWLFLTATCIAATLVNPYLYRVYSPALDYAGQRGFYDLISELQSPQFRTMAEWLLLGIMLGAAFLLGRRHKVNVSFVLLFLAGIVISFSAKRDIWLGVIVSIAIIADSLNSSGIPDYAFSKVQRLGIALGIVVALVLTMRATDVSEPTLRMRVAESLPVNAADFIQKHHYAGPLYNHFDWGGYLIWRLPHLPVAMDGRTNIYGVDKMKQSLNVWLGRPRWNSDAELTAAGVIVAQIDQPLTSLLKMDSRFDLVYEDKLAAVFVAHATERIVE